MSLTEMSLAGTVMILVIAAVRCFTVNRLPKSTFSLLWLVALVRLLVPYSLPSVYSVYSMVDRLPAAQPVAAPPAPIPFSPVQPEAPLAVTGPGAAARPVNWWAVLWLAGAVACVLWFALCYLRCRRAFRQSAPVENSFVCHWLATHRLYRPIEIRQSDRIAAPLTYGVLRPVILVPSLTDWTDTSTLSYVLEHEFIHIRRFDAAAKLLFTAALCLHWLNPAVWLMYFLANRDMELSCDEAVIRLFGQNARSGYAMALIHMEETKGSLSPLSNGFSKNAIEERIKAIMKTKKRTLWVSLIALVLVGTVAILFATSPKEATAPETTAETGSVRLLDGITLQLPPSVSRQAVSDTRDEFTRDGQVIGGLAVLELTVDQMQDQAQLLTYLQTNIAEGLRPADFDYYMASSGSIGETVIETGTLDRHFTHHIYQGQAASYDLWFEDPLSNTGEVQQIAASIRSEDLTAYAPSSGFRPEAVERIAFDNYSLPDGSWTAEDLQALLTAIGEDAAAGTMIPAGPHAQFHFDDSTYAIFEEGTHDSPYILLDLFAQDGSLTYTVYPECESILAWMEARGILETMHGSVLVTCTGPNSEALPFTFNVPDGYEITADSDTAVTITRDGQAVGGIRLTDLDESGVFDSENSRLSDYLDQLAPSPLIAEYLSLNFGGDAYITLKITDPATGKVWEQSHHLFPRDGVYFDYWVDYALVTEDERDAIFAAIQKTEN
ncbi:MAG: M56 family metallopeptidase [Eubacteriales bacterium]|nr:M56 family metallopeptidase [Eubacteriales bacterium]